MKSEMQIKCYDNDGKSYDRYTVVFAEKINGSYTFIGMSANPSHPLGFGQCDQSSSRIDLPTFSHLGKRVDFEKLPNDCQTWVKQIYEELCCSQI